MEEVTERNIHSNGIDNHESDGNTSFLRAARNGQLEKVLEHLKTNIDINTSNANGLNALHLASKDGHVEIVEELLKRGAIVDAATKKGNTALHIASLAGQEEVVKLLVHHGASVNVQSQNGFTPLYMAAQENHDNVVKFLLANGANQSLSTEDGFTPLAVAMQQGHDKVVTVLLENDTRGKVRLPALHIAAKKDDVRAAKLLLENDHNPDVTSKSGFTPLHIASHYGNQSIANLLIQKGADVNYSAKHNITPLHVAAKWGKNNMVAVLLEQGAHIEAKTRDGLTPLHCAARSGHEQVVDMLLEKSAPISSKTKNGLAPLHMAAQGDHVDAARILLYHRAPVDEVTVDYLTALHVAAHCGHVRVAKLLLDRQADANARALNGFTPLHIACKKNRIKVVELLLKHGACIGATTESGLTPLHVASFMGCMNIVIYLLQHDASPDIPTVRGETPLHLAARANQTDIIRILLRNGAQVDARAREQQTPLHIASRLGNVDIVMLLLQHGGKVDNSTKDMYTALHIAAKEGQDEVAAVLIENGASLNATTKKGFTPLHLAAKYGHLKVAKLLLQKEAPVDAQGKNGVTPLHVASHYDHQNVALLLLDKGASPHANAKNGHTPLHIAARKNQMDIAHTLLEYGAQPDAESKAGFTPLHLSSQEGHTEISALLLENKATPSQQSKNGLTPMHLCAQENKVGVAQVLHNNGAEIDIPTKGGYTPLHIASHYGQADMVKFLLSKDADVKATTALGYTPLHQAAQQGHTNIVNILLENSAQPNAVTNNGQTPLNIAQKLGYITVIDTLKEVTNSTEAPSLSEEKYRVVAPEAMQETYLSDSEEEGEDTLLGDQTYRYLTADEMKSLGDDSLPIDVTRDERMDSNRMVGIDDLNAYPPRHIEDSISPEHIHPNYVEYIKKTSDNVDISKHPLNIGFLVSFLVDARGGAMRGCRHSGVRVIVPPRCAHSPTRITCRYVRPQRTPHPPPLMEGEALASRVLELGPVGATFLGPVIIEVPHFAALRGKEREIVVLRSDNGESWKEHTVEATEDVLNEILRDSFDPEDLNQLEDVSLGRITRIVTQDFPQYFAVISRIRQEVHAIGPEGGMVSSTVVPQVQAVFPQGALTKKIKVGLQAQPIDPELTAKMLGHGVAVSPVVTVEPRRRKFHKAITLSMPAPRAHSQGMINQYSGSAPTLRLLCSITGGTSRAQWEDVTGSTPLTFVNDCVSFTTTVSARFWLMDCRNIGDATKMATELYREAIHVPFIAKFMVFAKRIDPLEARLRVFCMTDDKEEKTLEYQEQFTEIAKSRDVEVLEGKSQYIEFVGNLVPVTKSGEQLQFAFRAFKENRLPFSVRVKDQHAEAVSRCLFMREPKVQKGEPPQQPICILNILLPDDIVSDTISLTDSGSVRRKYYATENFDYYRQDPRLADISNLLGEDWVELANQLGLTTSEINVIKSEYPDSVAKQAQSMLRMWLSQSGNRTQANTLDNALRRIGREDIVIQCLNEDNRSQQIVRIRSEDKEKYRLRDQISEQDFSKREDYYLEHERGFKTKPDNFDKYSAEEKEIEPSDEEDDFNKTVPEIREQIVKRLSNARTIPASSQRVEIVQEISSIKRKSLVEDKLAEAQQKSGSDGITIITVKPISKVSHEKKIVSEDIPVEKASPEFISKMPDEGKEKETESRVDVSDFKTPAESDRRDSILLEEVTHRLESKKPLPKLIADEDPKSPKCSRTPPPSPADFIMREKEATTAQEWCATKTDLIDASTTQLRETSQEAEGQTTSPQYLDKLEKKLLDKTCDVKFPGTEIKIAHDFENILKETNAFLKYESQAEPYDTWTDSMCKNIKSEIESSPNTTPTKKRGKKGIFKTLKSFVTKSTENLSSEPEKMSPKSDRTDRKKKTSTGIPTEFLKTNELIETSSHKETSNGHGELSTHSSKKHSKNETQKINSESATTCQVEAQDSHQIIAETTVKKNVTSEGYKEKTLEKSNVQEFVDDLKDGFSKEQDHFINNSTLAISSSDTGAKIEGIDENTKHDSDVTTSRQLTRIDDSVDSNKEKNAQISDTERSTIQTSKKPGIFSFLTKKSKKSTVENEENVEKIVEKTGDKYNATQLFLQQEQNNYYCGSRQEKTEDHKNALSDLDKHQTKTKTIAKTGICESILSKLKPSDAGLADPEEASYIKFDEDDLLYDPITTIVHEKQKKVTFEEKAPEEILPIGTSIDEQSPTPKRLLCRLKEMSTDEQLIIKQDLVERASDCSRTIEGIKGREKTSSQLEYPHENLEQEIAYTISMIEQTDKFLETEKVSYQSEKTHPIEIMKQGECGEAELEKHALGDQYIKYQSPSNEKEVFEDIASKKTEMSKNAHKQASDKVINELYSKDISSVEDQNHQLKSLTDIFLKNEIDVYSDVKFVELTKESSAVKEKPKKHGESKSKRFLGLFSKKRKTSEESSGSTEAQKTFEDVSISNLEISAEKREQHTQETSNKESKFESGPDVKISSQSIEKRENTMSQSKHDEELTSERTQSDKSFPRKDQPIFNTISETRDFLLAENRYYDKVISTKVNATSTEPDLRTIRVEHIPQTSTLSHSREKLDVNKIMPQSDHGKHSAEGNASEDVRNENILPNQGKQIGKMMSTTRDFLSTENEYHDGMTYRKANSTPVDQDLCPQSTSREKQDKNKIKPQSKQDEYLTENKHTFETLKNEKLSTNKEQQIGKTIPETRDFLSVEKKYYDGMTCIQKDSAKLSPKMSTPRRKQDVEKVMPQSKQDEYFTQDKDAFVNTKKKNFSQNREQPIEKTIPETRHFLSMEKEYYDGMTYVQNDPTPVDPQLKTISAELSSQVSISRGKQDVKKVVHQSKQDEFVSTQDKDAFVNIKSGNFSQNKEQPIEKTIPETRHFLSIEKEYYDGMIYVQNDPTPVDPHLETISAELSSQVSISRGKPDVKKIMPQSKPDEYLAQDKDTFVNNDSENVSPIQGQPIGKIIPKTRDFLSVEKKHYDGVTYIQKALTPVDRDLEIISAKLSPQVSTSSGNQDVKKMIPQSKPDEYLTQDKNKFVNIHSENVSPNKEQPIETTIPETRDFLSTEKEYYDGMIYVQNCPTSVDPHLETVSAKFSSQVSTSRGKQDVKKIMPQSKPDEYLTQDMDKFVKIHSENVSPNKERPIETTIPETRDFLSREKKYYDGMIYVQNSPTPVDPHLETISAKLSSQVSTSRGKQDVKNIIPKSKSDEYSTQDMDTFVNVNSENISPNKEQPIEKTIPEMICVQKDPTPVDRDFETISAKLIPQVSTSRGKQDVEKVIPQSRQDKYLTREKDASVNIGSENVSQNKQQPIEKAIPETIDFLSLEKKYNDGLTCLKENTISVKPYLKTTDVKLSQQMNTSGRKQDQDITTPQLKQGEHLSHDKDNSENMLPKEEDPIGKTILQTRDFLSAEKEYYDGMAYQQKNSTNIDSVLKTVSEQLDSEMSRSRKQKELNEIMPQSKQDDYSTQNRDSYYNMKNENFSLNKEQSVIKAISETRDFLLAENKNYDGMTYVKKISSSVDSNLKTISYEPRPHSIALSQSTEKRDLSQEKHTGHIGNEDILSDEQHPIRRAISVTRDFLSAENEFYDGMTYTKRIQAPVDEDLRIMSEKLSSHLNTSMQSSEKRDEKEIISQSGYHEEKTQDKNISDNIEYENISPSKQPPIGELISKTKELLLMENEFYDGMTYTRKTLAPVDVDLKTISDQCIEKSVHVQHEPSQEYMDDNNAGKQSQENNNANSGPGMTSFAFNIPSENDGKKTKSCISHPLNSILLTHNFLHFEKYSYDSEVYKTPSDNRDSVKHPIILNLSSNIHAEKETVDMSTKTIPLKTTLVSEETSKCEMSNNDVKDDISKTKQTQIPLQEMIKSTEQFLDTEKIKYFDAKSEIHEVKGIKSSSDDSTTVLIKKDNEIDQNNKMPEKKSKGFLKIFTKKSKPKIEKRDEEKSIETSDFVDVTATDEFLNTEKFFYQDSIRHKSNKDEPKIIAATISVTKSDTSKTQTSGNKDKTPKPRGLFKIFSRKSEEKDVNVSKQDVIHSHEETKSTPTENKHDDLQEIQALVDIRQFLNILRANTFYQNCENIPQVTDVFLTIEKDLYNDVDRSKYSHDASKELREMSCESEGSEIRKQNSEKPLKKRNYLKIFHRKSEEEKHSSKHTDALESHKAQTSEGGKLEGDKLSEHRERFNIFGKKFRNKDKKTVHSYIDDKKDDSKDNIKLMQITNDFLHTEIDHYEDVSPITRIDEENLNYQFNGKLLPQEPKPSGKANMKSSGLKAENISEQEKTSRFDSRSSEPISPRQSVSDDVVNKMNSTQSEVPEPVGKLQQKKSGENKKLKGIRRKDKEGKSKGIFNLFSRRSKSKERNDDSEETEEQKTSNDVEACRMFLQNEIEMYIDTHSTQQTNQLKRTHSSISTASEFDRTGFGVDTVEKLSELPSRYIVSGGGPKTVHIDGEYENIKTSNIAPDLAVSIRSDSQEQPPSSENQKIEDLEKYNAFDFIREEVENFEKSRLPFTDTIDTSFRVETEIEHPEGNEAVEKVTKRIIISEKLIEKPSANKSATYIDTAKMLMNIRGALIDTPEHQQDELKSKNTSDLNDTESVNREIKNVVSISDKLPIQRKSTSKEKLECIEAEYVHSMKDPVLCIGDVIEDVSPLEKKIEIISNESEEKITDLDETVPKTLINITDDTDNEQISCVISDNIKQQIIENENESDAKKQKTSGVQFSDNSCTDKKVSVTKLGDKDFQPQDIPETIQVTENFVKEFDIQFHPDKSIFSKDENISTVESNNMEKQIIPITLTIDQHKKTYQDESNVHEINRDDKNINFYPRKPLFRLESEEEELVTKVKEPRTNISEIMSEYPASLKGETTKLVLDNRVVVDSKSDVEIIEDKLRDLGKALDALEKLSEIESDDKNEQLEQKKLRRVERKFERMASETLAASTNNETEVKTPNSRETDRYQQLVSHLSTDEVISLENDYNNLWDEYTFSKSDEWDSKTPESQADVLELPQGDSASQPPGTTELTMIKDIKHDSMKDTEEDQSKSQTYDQHQLSEEMKELLEEMEKTNKM